MQYRQRTSPSRVGYLTIAKYPVSNNKLFNYRTDKNYSKNKKLYWLNFLLLFPLILQNFMQHQLPSNAFELFFRRSWRNLFCQQSETSVPQQFLIWNTFTKFCSLYTSILVYAKFIYFSSYDVSYLIHCTFLLTANTSPLNFSCYSSTEAL